MYVSELGIDYLRFRVEISGEFWEILVQLLVSLATRGKLYP